MTIKKNYDIPLKKISLPQYNEVAKYLKKIDLNKIYTNYGPLVQNLEMILANHFKTDPKKVIITSNGTTSLKTILTSIKNKLKRPYLSDLRKEKKFYCILPSFTFTASAMSIIDTGLYPIFLDIDKNSAQLTPEIVEKFFRKNLNLKKNVIAVMPVSPFGSRINKREWDKFYFRNNIKIVYDEAWCFDSFSMNKVGDSAISLHATKSFGCGEGGVILTDDFQKSLEYRKIINFGLNHNKQSVIIGYNGKMSEYNAAVALTSIEKWSENKSKCLELQRHYINKLCSLSKIKILDGFDTTFAWGSLPLIFKEKVNLKKIITNAAANKIEFRDWWKQGLHKFPAFEVFPKSCLKNTNSLSQRIINVPFYPDMELDDIDKVCNELYRYDK